MAGAPPVAELATHAVTNQPPDYGGVDLLILMGVARDLILDRRIHQVYLYGLPAFIVGQTVVIFLYQYDWPLCLKITHAVVG